MSSAQEYYGFLNTDPARDTRERLLKEETARAGLDTTRQAQERMRGTIADEATIRRRAAEAEASDKAMAADEMGAPEANNTTVVPGHMGTVEEANALRAEATAPPATGAMAGRSAPGAAPAAPLRQSPAMLLKRAKEFRARGDHKAADALLTQATQASELDQDNASIAQAREMMKDPKTVQRVLSMLNKDPRVTVGTDGKGKFAITAQNAQGIAGMPDHISQADMIQLLHGANLLSTNPTKGLAIISGVSTSLGAHLKELNDQQLKVQRGNVDVDQAGSQRISANAAMQRVGLDRKSAAAAARTMDPAIASQLEDLRVQIDELPDNDPRRTPLVQSYNRLYGQGALSMGKTVAPREPRAPEAFKANADGTYSKGTQLFREDPKKPGQLIEIVQPGQSATDKGIAALLAARQGGAAPAPAKAPGMAGPSQAPARPPAAPGTGVEGLSPIALRRVAADPTNPSAPAARAALEQLARQSEAGMRERTQNPEFDPAMYQ